MRRDFDLIRSILLQTEEAPAGQALQTLRIEGDVEDGVVADHVQIAIDAGLLKGVGGL